MNALIRAFYSLALLATQFELAVAKSAPVPNRKNIAALRRDISEYEAVLDRTDLAI